MVRAANVSSVIETSVHWQAGSRFGRECLRGRSKCNELVTRVLLDAPKAGTVKVNTAIAMTFPSQRSAAIAFLSAGGEEVWSCIRSVGAEVASSGRSRIARGKIKHRIQIGKIEANAFLWKKRQG